jgi:hypothetical protein
MLAHDYTNGNFHPDSAVIGFNDIKNIVSPFNFINLVSDVFISSNPFFLEGKESSFTHG